MKSAGKSTNHAASPGNAVSIVSYRSGKTTIKNRITLSQHLFSFLLEGEKTVTYAGATTRITPDSFLLLSAGNCLMSEKIVAEGGSYRSVLISFDTMTLADFFTVHPQLLQSSDKTPAAEPVLLFKKDAFLISYIESLEHLLATRRPLSHNMTRLKLNELLLYLSENYPGYLQSLRSICRETSDDMQIRQAVNASIDSRINIEELAFLCNMSLSTFKRRFARIYGASPNKWFLEKRMERAARLLKQGDQNASGIFYEIGYENLSSFIHSFKQFYGVTPKQYQKQPSSNDLSE